MLTAVTFNLHLAAGIRLSDRNRADLDWKNGIFTWRYRKAVTRTNFCDPLLSLHPVCRRRALLREPVWQMEYHCSLCGFSVPCGKTCAIQLLLGAREQHRQTPKPAGECGGAGSLCLLFSRKVVNLAVPSAGPWAVTFDNYPLLRLMPTLPYPLVCGRPLSAARVFVWWCKRKVVRVRESPNDAQDKRFCPQNEDLLFPPIGGLKRCSRSGKAGTRELS